MTGLTHTISDIKTLFSNDKRVWSCLGFIFCALVIWLSTNSWRQSPPATPEQWVNVRVEEEILGDLAPTFNKDMQEAKEEREYLRNYLNRFNNELEVSKKEMDWQVNILVNKLDDMSDKVDGLIHKVGERSVEKAKLNKKLQYRKGSKRQKQKVDRSLL